MVLAMWLVNTMTGDMTCSIDHVVGQCHDWGYDL